MSWAVKGAVVVLSAATVLFLMGAPYLNKISRVERMAQIKINDQTIVVDVVSKAHELKRGLAGREQLGVNEGMFFVFQEAGMHAFWMKDVQFPIDIIWIADDRIVGIVEHVEPELNVPDFELTSYYPPEPVDRVLEIAPGRAKLLRAAPGDKVKIQPLISSYLLYN